MSLGELLPIICILTALVLIAAIWLWSARAFRGIQAMLDRSDRGEREIETSEASEPALTMPQKLSPDRNNENPPRLPEFGRVDALGAKIDALTARINALTAFIEGEQANPPVSPPERRTTLKVVRGGKSTTSRDP